ncbi:MAG: hypothetical protein K9M19_06165, partial [Candidatus Marinimicrobia bacterium]|nr:hypothetical protein [Candidatus Neomarinimicrobiota bacterium]
MKAEFQPTDGSENASGWDRRHFLQTTLLSGLALTVPFRLQGQLFGKKVILPPRLKPGDTVGLINPAGATFY